MGNNLGQRTGLCVGGIADGEFHTSQYEQHLVVNRVYLDPPVNFALQVPKDGALAAVETKHKTSHYDLHPLKTEHGEFHLWVCTDMTLDGALTKILNGYAVLKKREKEQRHG